MCERVPALKAVDVKRYNQRLMQFVNLEAFQRRVVTQTCTLAHTANISLALGLFYKVVLMNASRALW